MEKKLKEQKNSGLLMGKDKCFKVKIHIVLWQKRKMPN